MVSFLLPRQGMWGKGHCSEDCRVLSPPPFPSLLSPTPASGWNAASSRCLCYSKAEPGWGPPQPPNIRPGGLSELLAATRHPPGLLRPPPSCIGPSQGLAKTPAPPAPSASPCEGGVLTGPSPGALPQRLPHVPLHSHPGPSPWTLSPKLSSASKLPSRLESTGQTSERGVLMRVRAVQGPA